jgi:hypothetical protein
LEAIVQQDEDDKLASFAVLRFRIQELEKRQGRTENFILGFFVVVTTAFLYGVFSLLKLPTP